MSRLVCSCARGALRLVAPILALVASPALAADHFLTIGGGDAPARNQVSLEKNVRYLQRVLDDLNIGQSHHDIYFSDGDDAGRDLQTHTSRQIPRVNQLLARVLGSNESSIQLEYRNQEIERVRGSSTRKSLVEWFDKQGSKLAAGDRLVIYFTGHGGWTRGSRNTNLTLWRENSMPVKEFVGLLDKLPAKVQVVLIMVQCHAGGFADVIYKNANPSGTVSGLSDRDRCGFFATVPERPAAGCTPDIDEENYHEYSTYFWEAISGKTRLGSAVKRPDYDGDGKVSFAEAHAYVKLTSGTIDIPISTSDVFLRSFSKAAGGLPPMSPMTAPSTQPIRRFPPRTSDGAPRTEAPPPPECAADLDDAVRPPTNVKPAIPPIRPAAPAPAAAPGGKNLPLFSVDTPYHTLVQQADPARKAVLEGLSEQLKLTGPERARGARDLSKQFQRQKDDFEGQKRTARQNQGFSRDKVANAVRGRWPELSTAFHPRQLEILQTESADVVKVIEGHEAFKQMEQQRELYEKLDEKALEVDRKWVKTQRFLRTLEDVALAANLPKLATPEVQERYKKLLAAEYGSIENGK